MQGRRTLLLIACLTLGWGVGRASAQSPDDLKTTFWPRRDFHFPLNADRVKKAAAGATEMRLFASINRGPFEQVSAIGPRELKDIDSGKLGFDFKAPRDGEYEFDVQFVYPDGTVSPRPEQFQAQARVVIDTLPPSVRIAPVGNRVEWDATDENLDPRSVGLECKFPSDTKWYAVSPVREDNFKASDRYAWQLKPGQQLDVRVRAEDRAGNKGVSRVVRVPGPAGATGLAARDPLTAVPGDWPPRSPAGLGADPFGPGTTPQTQIAYVNTLDFTVDTSINHMGRSGVKAVHLFVSKDQRTWKPAEGSPFKIVKKGDDEDRSVSLPYKAEKEGLFGFIVIPESGAGKRAPDPVQDSPAMVLVEVDTTKPYAKIKSVEVLPGDARGPRVDITWDATDRNLMGKPVSLEYALDKKAVQWQPIALQIENNLTKETGRYSWYVPDEKLWRFYVRIRAVDKAANTGEQIYENEVLVDLEKPDAVIKAIQTPHGGGSKATPPSAESGGIPIPPRATLPPSIPRPASPGSTSPSSDMPSLPSLDKPE